jgi:hypothetical protein
MENVESESEGSNRKEDDGTSGELETLKNDNEFSCGGLGGKGISGPVVRDRV